MDLAAEAHAPLAMVKVWLGEEELASESIEKACRNNYSTLHLGQAPPESHGVACAHAPCRPGSSIRSASSARRVSSIDMYNYAGGQ